MMQAIRVTIDPQDEDNESALLAQPALASDWLEPEEDLAWTHLQPGKTDSVTPSTRLLNQKLGIVSAPRMLQPPEIALLRQSKQEIARKVARK